MRGSTPLRGIIPPMVTPLIDRDALDEQAVERLSEKMIAAGVSGLFTLGTTGEAAGLSYRVRDEMVQRACCAAGGRVPVLVNITDTSMVESLKFAERAAKAGAAALVTGPPYYFALTQSELLRYLERLTAELPLPLYLYNYPAMMKTEFSPETIAIAADYPNVCGLKDSSGDLGYLAAVIRKFEHRPDFAIFCGPEEQLAEAVSMGAHGGVTGGANLWPELYVSLYKAAAAGDKIEAGTLQATILHLSAHVYHLSRAGSSYIRGLKCAMSILGYCRNVLADPFQPYGAEETQQIRGALARAGMLDGVGAES